MSIESGQAGPDVTPDLKKMERDDFNNIIGVFKTLRSAKAQGHSQNQKIK